ncbi:hypothetical protein DWW31_18375 [Clostridium sp. AF15-17LB]|nr:hypothetical protein DWW31_18375 [Clostridium sp. AF15-17LB]
MDRSIFDPYYSRIQDLLFRGYTKKETYDYIEANFHVYSSYRNFCGYIERRNLEWFMPLLPEFYNRYEQAAVQTGI